MWFEQLTGFPEKSPDFVRENLIIDGNTFISKANGKEFTFGQLEIPTLLQLKNQTQNFNKKGKLQVSEIVADVQALHAKIENKNALFQVASQFNLLEMVSPQITPEKGIDRYEFDRTQGPACAIACGAGTIYRNYFVKVNNQIGQTAFHQIDGLDLIGKTLNNKDLNLWKMQNGYALISQEGLLYLNKTIAQFTEEERENLKEKLKVGIQWNTEVTLSKTRHQVSQIYCSTEAIYWESFAKIILEATYEATLYAALRNVEKYDSNIVYLTLVGGGAFGNEEYWIMESMEKAILQFKDKPLDIRIVSYGCSNPSVRELVEKLKS